MAKRFIQYFEDSFKENWDLPAMTNYETKQTYAYKDVAQKIAKLHLLFRELNIKNDDKIALIGDNSPEWAITFSAVVTYGAVVVPILKDFHKEDIYHIINHSESKLLFATNSIWTDLDKEKVPDLRGVFELSDFRCVSQAPKETIHIAIRNLYKNFSELYPSGYSISDIVYDYKDDEEVVALSYTSGTEGYCKGVMLTGENFCFNVDYVMGGLGKRGQKAVSLLPMAHSFGCLFDLLIPMILGGHITYLNTKPSPQLMLKAMTEVKPNWIFSVPLLLEMIYKRNILPNINNWKFRVLSKIPFLSNRLYLNIKNQLMDVFGGDLIMILLGGASLNKEVEDFLVKIKFPYSIGYGMTECAPLISADYLAYVPYSVGKVLNGVDVKIDSIAPNKTPGEILVKGKNVMKGYYKNPQETDKVFTKDGWLKTGDMGTLDEKRNLYIKGRCKTMILTSSGQNVYPEEIESKLNNMPYVKECLVVQRKDKIVAIIYPNFEVIDTDELSTFMYAKRIEFNKRLASFERISLFEVIDHPFEKTPKRSIKRHLYL